VFEIGKDRSPRGRKKLLAEHQQHLDLVAKGAGTVEACRTVGINRRTGHRWRRGRTSQAKTGRTARRVPAARPVRSSDRFLSVDERIVIADLPRVGHSLRSNAAELGRSPSTISREIDLDLQRPRPCRRRPAQPPPTQNAQLGLYGVPMRTAVEDITLHLQLSRLAGPRSVLGPQPGRLFVFGLGHRPCACRKPHPCWSEAAHDDVDAVRSRLTVPRAG
jgi:hypothetical protein